ncbi:DUF6660 family protein [Parapedobacter koreensis]|uniref:DUF6660 family protein n=1 Tax=Parapedobacter koreensis TaxID=332977 RepID=UPI000B87B8F4|nr:DUF6660 family protein [Parapedobacter koreensis]
MPSIILLVYISLLSLVPCHDDIAALGFEKPSTYAAADHLDDHFHDLCSPFCVCSCCGAALGLHVGIGPVDAPGYFPLISKDTAIYGTNLIPNLFLSKIWQPPQATV